MVEKPVQLKVWEPDDEGTDYRPFGAVGYLDEVICMCCGTTFDRDYLTEERYMYETLSWVNLSDEVMGDE